MWILGIGVCVCIGLVSFVALRMYIESRDYSLQRSNDAQSMVRGELGSNVTSNEYFVVHGFLQGVTCYYRCDTTYEAVQQYVNKGNGVVFGHRILEKKSEKNDMRCG